MCKVPETLLDTMRVLIIIIVVVVIIIIILIAPGLVSPYLDPQLWVCNWRSLAEAEVR